MDGSTEDSGKNGNDEEQKPQVRAEPDYVVVSDPSSEEPIELPTNTEDNTLGLTTLQHAFPGAHGLKYKNPKTGAMRALLIDTSGTKFFPPAGGWDDKVFVVIYQNEPTKRVLPSETSSKRKKLMDESVASDSDGEGNGLHHGAQVTKLQRLNEEQLDERHGKSKQERKSRDEDVQQLCCDLIVLGLPFSLDEDGLKEYFQKFGQVDMAEIKRDGAGKSRGFGFIRMSTVPEQNAVLDAVHHIDGRRCQVKFPVLKSEMNDGRVSDNVRLFVGKLTDKITPGRLREFFGAEARKIDPRAQITDVYVPKPFRGFAFVTLSSPRVAKEFLKKDDYVIDGIEVTISIAAPKQLPQSSSQPPAYQPGYGAYDAHYPGIDKPAEYPDPWETHPSYASSGGDSRFRSAYEANRYGYDDPRYDNSSPYPTGGSSALTTGLETLNLNNMKPDVMDEALKAFWTVANRQSGKTRNDRPGPPGPAYPPQHRRGPYPGPASSNNWR